MALKDSTKENIAREVIKTLVTRFQSFPSDSTTNRNAPFHEAFLNAFSDKLDGNVPNTAFFVSLSSWLQGLNTTLGQTFFENIGHHISNGEKREYTSGRLGCLKITPTQRTGISQIMADLSTSDSRPNLERENELIFEKNGTPSIYANSFSADIFYEDENSVTAIELKSVKPNSGEMKGEKLKILEGKAALFWEFPNKKIFFYIGFPFDPNVNPTIESKTSSNKTRFLGSIINMNKYFDKDETLLADEFWDFLSGEENTMEQILALINLLATPQFLEKMVFLKNNDNRNKPEYLALLKEWQLFSEIELIENDTKIKTSIKNNAVLTRLYNHSCFNAKGQYNYQRYSALKDLIPKA